MEIFTDLSHPLLLALAVIAVSWIWEDAAVISGALLAVEHKLSVPLALTAVFVGIVSGDMALYYLGRLANRWRGLRAWIITKPQGRAMSRKFKQKTLTNILLIRFVPGLRTLGFTLCGLWKVSLMRFSFAMGFAGVIWIAVIFSGVYKLGSADFFENSHWKWSLMLLALVLLVVNNLWAFWRNRSRSAAA